MGWGGFLHSPCPLPCNYHFGHSSELWLHRSIWTPTCMAPGTPAQPAPPPPGSPSERWCVQPGQQRVEIHKLRQGENLILGFSIGGGIDQDPSQNPFSEDKTDKGIYVTRVSEGGPAEIAGLQIGDKIMQVNGWDMTMVTHDQARKRLTKRSEEVVRLLVTRQSLQKAVQQSMLS
ncbi:tax1-binding protein 3 isoform X1 [Otolemur garnettii]|uniref:tax1-binding protein 3 isoform X1 n=1 Tax=Otolemur garnettii TaxID=30611 RepID=UPI0006440E0E|nr:tax1-binding protein 3 isoform X1 [Otolemur garnettii]